MGVIRVLQFRVFQGGAGTFRVAREELLLVVPARPPAQHITDVQTLPSHMTDHGFRRHPFGRVLVMRTSARMYMGITGIPPKLHRINPALEIHFNAIVAITDGDWLNAQKVFRASRAVNGVFAVG